MNFKDYMTEFGVEACLKVGLPAATYGILRAADYVAFHDASPDLEQQIDNALQLVFSATATGLALRSPNGLARFALTPISAYFAGNSFADFFQNLDPSIASKYLHLSRNLVKGLNACGKDINSIGAGTSAAVATVIAEICVGWKYLFERSAAAAERRRTQ